MKELSSRQVNINDPFWTPRLEVNATHAIFHQWDQLEATHCIENFRIAAGEKDGFREGWFFADSDAYKWLDAASRIHALHPQPRPFDQTQDKLASLMDSLVSLLARAQMDDGYLFTYNQIHFPGQRWVNLQVEHELYCHGHLIEAGVSRYEATGRRDLLDICMKAADLLVHDFLNVSNDKTCGHEEIEIALIRLYRVTQNENYLELARQFVERRGRILFFPLHLWREFRSHERRSQYVKEMRKAYLAEHPEHQSFKLPGNNYTPKPRFSRARWYINALRGFYAQPHTPIRKQTSPMGHSVRFGYLETAVAMLCREDQKLLTQTPLNKAGQVTQSTQSGNASKLSNGTSLESVVSFVVKKDTDVSTDLLSAMEQAWERMVTRRMYITGGLGAVPGLEGFGADYELDPEYAYAETCASLASLFWNWEMVLLTKDARYSDLFEWQLYNATNVGMGKNGDTYLYNNPLEVHHGVTRKGWYVVPCCPSNLSRTFADLGKYIFSFDENDIWIHQYISSETTINGVKIKIESGLPWNGNIKVRLKPETPGNVRIHLRNPAWDMDIPRIGYDPRAAEYKTLSTDATPTELSFDMSIKLRCAHPKVKGHAGKVAITRGPLVYCLESVDNPNVDIFMAQLDPNSLHDEFVPDMLGGCVVIRGKTTDGTPLNFIPYFLWANRGEPQMTDWVNSK